MALGIRRCLNIIIGILIRILRYDLKEVSKIKFNPVIFAVDRPESPSQQLPLVALAMPCWCLHIAPGPETPTKTLKIYIHHERAYRPRALVNILRSR